MQLRRSHIAGYIALARPNDSDEDRAARAARLNQALLAGRVHPGTIRVALGPTGAVVAALRLHPLGASSAEIGRPMGDPDIAAGLLDELMDHAVVHEVDRIGNRPRLDQLSATYRAALLRAGFQDRGERVEFRAPIDRLPDESGTPLTWEDMDAVGRDVAVDMLRRVAEGDPTGVDEREAPAETLDDWLSDDALSRGGHCVHVGSLENAHVAFVCAQVARKDGWSRITHMGLVSGARGQGLGQWVHRHGFTMMRDQGGTLYHGGTAASNLPMLRLFEKHGCDEYLRMRNFEWSRR